VRDGVAAGGGPFERVAIADVAVHQRTGQPTAAGGTREDDELVPADNSRADDGAAEISGATCHEDSHRSIALSLIGF
jgi:hypothetical protein